MIEQDGGFLLTIIKDILNENHLVKLGLNERQIKAVFFAKGNGKITNKEYQILFKISRETSSERFSRINRKGVFKSSGTKGAGSYYELSICFIIA